MGLGRFMRVLPLLCLLYASSWAFVLRDWDQEEDNVGRLADALKIIEKERQRIQQEEEAEARGFRQRPRPYPWDEDEEESAVTNELLEELLEGEGAPRGVDSQAADINEIRDIFEPSEVEEDKKRAVKKSLPIPLGGKPKKRLVMKKSLPIPLGGKGGKREYDPTSEKKKKQEESTTLSAEEVSKLLSAADGAEEEVLESEDVETGEEANEGPEEVSQEELKQVLEGDEGDQDEEDEEEEGLSAEEMASLRVPMGEEPWSNFPEDINKELLLSEYLQSMPPEDYTKKKKVPTATLR